MRTLICLSLALALAGCKKEEKAATNPTAVSKPGDPPSSKDPTEVVKPAAAKVPWGNDYGALTAKLQGAWLVKDVGYLGSVQAWNVEGTKVTMYDPKKKAEQVGEL